jgi:hypothetical protein
LLRVGGEAGRAVVERASQDPLTQSDVRRALPDVLAGPAKPAAAASAKPAAGPAKAATAAAAP